MSEMIEQVTKALLDNLELRPGDGGEHGCLFDASPDGDVVIRGHVYLPALARAAIEAMREPTQHMIDNAAGCGIAFPRQVKAAYHNMIAAALAEPERRVG